MLQKPLCAVPVGGRCASLTNWAPSPDTAGARGGWRNGNDAPALSLRYQRDHWSLHGVAEAPAGRRGCSASPPRGDAAAGRARITGLLLPALGGRVRVSEVGGVCTPRFRSPPRGHGQSAPRSGNVCRGRAGRGRASATGIGMRSPEGDMGRQQPEGRRRARAADSPGRSLQGAVTTTTPGAWGVEHTGGDPAALGRWSLKHAPGSRPGAQTQAGCSSHGQSGAVARGQAQRPARPESHPLRPQSPESGRLSGDGGGKYQFRTKKN